MEYVAERLRIAELKCSDGGLVYGPSGFPVLSRYRFFCASCGHEISHESTCPYCGCRLVENPIDPDVMCEMIEEEREDK